MEPLSGEVTRLLIDLRDGRKEAEAQLFELLYEELRRRAGGYMKNERPEHTLQPTALVHEAYVRMVEKPQQNWENRAHFLAVCANIMRQILVDHARRRNAEKRGGNHEHVALDESVVIVERKAVDTVALHETLLRLEKLDPRQSRVVEMHFFGGMTEEEISHVLGMSVRTVKRDLRVARAWLFVEMKLDGDHRNGKDQ